MPGLASEKRRCRSRQVAVAGAPHPLAATRRASVSHAKPDPGCACTSGSHRSNGPHGSTGFYLAGVDIAFSGLALTASRGGWQHIEGMDTPKQYRCLHCMDVGWVCENHPERPYRPGARWLHRMRRRHALPALQPQQRPGRPSPHAAVRRGLRHDQEGALSRPAKCACRPVRDREAERVRSR